MINVNLPQLSKESVIYVIGAVVAALLMFGCYLGGATLGAAEVERALQTDIDELTKKLAKSEDKVLTIGLDLAGCEARKSGDCILNCEGLCRERVDEAIKEATSLCGR